MIVILAVEKFLRRIVVEFERTSALREAIGQIYLCHLFAGLAADDDETRVAVVVGRIGIVHEAVESDAIVGGALRDGARTFAGSLGVGVPFGVPSSKSVVQAA